MEFLGLSEMPLTSFIVVWALLVAIWLALYSLVINWPRSTSVEEFEKNLVTQIERLDQKIWFNVPNPMKPGKLLRIKFMAKSKDEAEQIEQALRTAREG